MSDVTADEPTILGPFDPEQDVDTLTALLAEHDVTHFRTVGGKILKTVGRVNRKSMPYSAVNAATWPHARIESFGRAPMEERERWWTVTGRENQWTR